MTDITAALPGLAAVIVVGGRGEDIGPAHGRWPRMLLLDGLMHRRVWPRTVRP